MFFGSSITHRIAVSVVLRCLIDELLNT